MLDNLAGYESGIAIALITFVISVSSPGPALLSVMGTAMARGRRAGLYLGLGVVAGTLTWALLAMIGVSALLSNWAGAMTLIRVLGGAYLVYLALRSVRSAMQSGQPVEGGGAETALASFLRGWLIHLTNPKAVLAWTAIISLGMVPGAPLIVGGAIIASTTTYAVVFYAVVALAFSSPATVRAYQSARRWIEGALAGFYLFAAWKLATR